MLGECGQRFPLLCMVLSCGDVFADIETIRKAQFAAGAVKEESSQSEDTEDDEALEDCIVVR